MLLVCRTLGKLSHDLVHLQDVATNVMLALSRTLRRYLAIQHKMSQKSTATTSTHGMRSCHEALNDAELVVHNLGESTRQHLPSLRARGMLLQFLKASKSTAAVAANCPGPFVGPERSAAGNVTAAHEAHQCDHWGHDGDVESTPVPRRVFRECLTPCVSILAITVVCMGHPLELGLLSAVTL